MKKNYFMLALASMMMAACANNDLVDDLVKEEVPQAIGFETFANSATRAENSSQGNKWDLEAHQTSFNVWAAKQLGNDQWVEVYKDADTDERVYWSDSKWNVTNTKYWDKAATKYIFYAAAPAAAGWGYDVNSTATDFSDDFLTLSGVTMSGTNLSVVNGGSIAYQNSWLNAGGDVDYLIATDKEVERGFYTAATINDVNLEFNHILSRLNVTVKKSDALNTAGVDVKVTGLTIGNLLNGGNFNEKANLGSETLSTGTTKRWTTSGTKGSITGFNYTMTNEAAYLVQSLIIPQEAAYQAINRNGTTSTEHPYINIKYTLNDEPYEATYNLAHSFVGETTLRFCEGWQNTLNITIDADAISFDAEVYQWSDLTSNGSTID